ncbi:MAG TPA: transcriptional repressor [Chitinophagaceae bacterium]|nr:transcriptional repressor [Chitinophagaceae bacterium]
MSEMDMLFKRHNLRKTKLRKAVFDILKEANMGLSHQEISKQVHFDFDRVSLFRTLSQFEKVGIIHKILDLQGVANYALTFPISDNNKCLTHFICEKCSGILCVDEEFIKIQDFQLKYKELAIKDVEITLKGICKKCKNKE